jgi:phosphoserine aminotransferase
MQGAEASIRSLLGVDDDYAVLFLQGGARLQFSMLPANLLRGQAGPAQYLITGSWSKYALAEAKKEGPVEVLWDGKATNYDRLPESASGKLREDAAYVYYCSNETIQGVQFDSTPHSAKAPLICDASSDFLSRPVDVSRHGVLFACAQKNAGPAGVTVVIIRRDLLSRGDEQLPGYLLLRNHAENDSSWNTPPTFAIYVMGLVAQWIQDDVGGLVAMETRNQRKSRRLYELLDRYPDFYQGHAQAACRSQMNVTFRLPDEAVEKEFLRGAAQRSLGNLKGHRSVGGIRASIYNAMPLEGVETLANYMEEFARDRA